MRTTARLLSGLVAPLLVLSLAGCGGDEPATNAPVLSERQAERALLAPSDLKPGYRKLPERDDEDDDDDLAVDCLGGAAMEFGSAKGATEVQVEFRKETKARGGTESLVLSAVSSHDEAGGGEAMLDDLRETMADCETAEYEQDGATISFDISLSKGRSTDELDQQLNLLLDGEVSVRGNSFPLVVQLRYFRIDNHVGTLSVTQFNIPGQAAEVDRLLGLAVSRFVAAVDEAA